MTCGRLSRALSPWTTVTLAVRILGISTRISRMVLAWPCIGRRLLGGFHCVQGAMRASSRCRLSSCRLWTNATRSTARRLGDS
eukprot:10817978-Lingulodinium_polyedra.AAC.1